MHNRVDPAALLLAVLVVSVGPITAAGPWEPIDSGFAILVAVIVGCFTWPRKRDREFRRRHAVAHALTYGFIAVTACAWPIQAVMQPDLDPHCNRFLLSADKNCYGASADLSSVVELEVTASLASLWALLGGLITFVIVLAILLRRVVPAQPRRALMSSRPPRIRPSARLQRMASQEVEEDWEQPSISS